MIINRQNYQIWITDYFDGHLDDFQVEVLMDFLKRNPDLMSEFEDYAGLILKPDGQDSYDKSGLLRTPEELTNEQVEHLSIAMMENDLSEKQKEEINELKKTDPRFRESIGIYEKIKLRPGNLAYPDRSSLLKIPYRRKIIKIIVSTVSIAATIAIITGLFFIFSQPADEYTNAYIAENNQTSPEKSQLVEERPTLLDIENEEARYIPAKTQVTVATSISTAEIIKDDSLPVQYRTLIEISPLRAKSDIRLDDSQTHYLLAEIDPYPTTLPADFDDNTDLSVREFLAYHFRKQILKEEDPDIENLKAWEIADAGIMGVNTLLGWNMELDTEKNEEGKLKSISFTSELIKFDHNSKKNKPAL
ncbi:MAG: hypothetical protein ACQERS_04805 [Bacteroidota bacterium]